MKRALIYLDGYRAARKEDIAWLHDRAKGMNDPHAAAVLNSAASDLGHRIRVEKAEARRMTNKEN